MKNHYNCIMLIVACFTLTLFSSPTYCSEPTLAYVSIPPQKYLVEQIGGEKLNVKVLIDSGQSPHSFEFSPRHIEELSSAQYYFSIGLPFEIFLLEKLSTTHENMRHIAMNQGISARTSQSTVIGNNKTLIASDKKPNSEPSQQDPHIWLSPPLLKIQVRNIYNGLVKYMPQHRKYFDKRLNSFLKQIKLTDATIIERLKPFKGQSFYVFHPAFGHFADAYKLKQHAIEFEGKSPTPKTMSSIIEKAKSDRVRVIFAQPQFDSKSAQTIAEAINGAVVQLDPLAEDVLANLKYIAQNIQTALIQK